MADHSAAARVLFGNLITPAAMIAGAIVPLGFLGPPMPRDTKWKKTLDSLFNWLTIVALANELLAIMYATVSSNMLLRVESAPAVSVFALIERDYELAWIATNVHFMLGLISFVGMVTTRSLAFFRPSLNMAAAGFGTSAVLLMLSVANYGVRIGDGRGRTLGHNFFALIIRYISLLGVNMVGPSRPRFLAIASCLLAMTSSILAGYNIWKPEARNDVDDDA